MADTPQDAARPMTAAEPNSAEWWRQVAQGLSVKAFDLQRALELMLEAYEAHDSWCGNKPGSPGNSLHWQAANAARNALGVERTQQPYQAPALRGPGHPEPPAERRGAMLRAEWDEACYLAREDYTKDPHAHIEALITAGDAVLAALSAPPPGQDTAGLVEAVRRWQTAVSKNGSTAEECAEAAAADDELLAFPLPAPTEET